MNWGGPIFVIMLVAISTFGWVATSWIRAKHGYPVENEFGGKAHKGDPDAERRIELLSTENGRLIDRVARLEERIAVLERIATDPAARVAHEIEALR